MECIASLQGHALHAVNARQSNFQRSGRSKRGINNAVLDEEAQLSPVVSTWALQRPTQNVGRAVGSMVERIGLSVVRISGPRRVADTP